MQRTNETHDDRARFPTAIIAAVAIAFAVIIALVLIFSYFSSRYSYYGGYGWGGMMGGFGGFGMLFMIPIGLVILVIIGYVIYRGIWWGRGCCGSHYGYYGHHGHYESEAEQENAMEILRRRYASGEISKEQFEQMKKDIIT
jgi:putative membrane protein